MKCGHYIYLECLKIIQKIIINIICLVSLCDMTDNGKIDNIYY